MIVCISEPQFKHNHKTSKLVQTTRYITYNMHSILFTRLGANQSNLKHNQAWGCFTPKAYVFTKLKRIKGGEAYLDSMHKLQSASKNARVG